MSHKWTECKLDIDTKIITSNISYEYTCSICNKIRRYTYPSLGESVFCNGSDFGTRPIQDIISENRIHNVLSQLYTDDKQMLIKMRSSITIDPENTYELHIISNLYNLNILEKSSNSLVYTLTEFGKVILGKI